MSAVGAAYFVADGSRRVALAPRRRANRVLGAIAAIAILIVLVAGQPVEWTRDAVASFKKPDYTALESQRSRFTGDLGSNRYDYWRSALGPCADHPLRGVGADGWGPTYLRDRRSGATPRYAHSVWLETAATLGLPGAAALIAFVLAIATAYVQALRRAPDWLLLAAAAPLLVVLLHASLDWVSFFPVLTVPAVALAAS